MFTHHRTPARLLAATLGLVAALAASVPSAVLAANPEGTLDSSYDGDGKLTVDNGANTGVVDAARQPDGKIVLTGSWNNGVTNETFVQRLTTTGASDPTFSGDGIFRILIGTNDGGTGIGVQADGKIVVVADTGATFTVLRLTSTGVLDSTFGGGDGYVSTALGAVDQANPDAFALHPDGSILVGGELQGAIESDAYIARFTGTGVLDAGFGVAGVRLIDNAKYDYVTALTVQPDGRILAVGSTGDDTVGGSFTARLTSGGALDTTWNGTGRYVLPSTSSNDIPVDALVDPLGRLVFVGYAAGVGFITRFGTSGTPDLSFNGTGTLTTGASLPRLVAAEPNGRLVLAGASGQDWFVERRLASGVADPSFATNGRVVTSVGASYDNPARLLVDGAGRIMVVGSSQGANTTVSAARYVGDATVPFGAVMTGLPTISTATTRTLGWTASDDNTGVASYTIQYRSAAYSASSLSSATTWKTDTTTAYGSFTGSAGRTYCFTVRAKDKAGNAGPYGAQRCVAIPVNDRTLTRSGTWTSLSSSAYYKGTASRSTTAGSTLKLTGVRYRRLSLVATTCSGCGKVSVYRGTTLLKTVSLSSSTTRHKVIIAIDLAAAVQSGTITIKQVSGGKQTVIEGLAVGLY